MRKWSTQVSTVVVNVGRELSLLKMAINMANADYPSFFLWNELEPRCQQRAAGSLELVLVVNGPLNDTLRLDNELSAWLHMSIMCSSWYQDELYQSCVFLPPSWRHAHAHFGFAHRQQPLRWLKPFLKHLALRIDSPLHAQMNKQRHKTWSFCLKYYILFKSNKIQRQVGGIFHLWQFLLDQIAHGR